jgi:UMF1 family MFS transporter
VLTLQIFIATYTTVGLGFPESLVINLALVSLSIITISAFLIGRIAEKYTTQKVIKWGILSWFFVFTSLVFVQTEIQFYLAIIANSIVFGSLFSLSRSYYSELCPKEEQGKYFSVYTLFERSASIIGPLLWSLTTIVGSYFISQQYVMRLNVLVLGLMVLVGYYFFIKHIKEVNKNI